MLRIAMLVVLSSSIALSGCSCARRHELPLKPGMPEDEVLRVLREHGYVDLPTQWYPYANAHSGAIALYRPRKRSRRFVVIDWRFLYSEKDDHPVLEASLLQRFAHGVSKEPYVSTPPDELEKLLDAQETASHDED